uniref:Uncharacterized protein n=1 Tax=Oryza sativa subsp. japonica TaxID=39947 RepID=Q6ZCY0_ORYSJ|nr:hypothetical protein [Oryza sativa Japonica Group]
MQKKPTFRDAERRHGGSTTIGGASPALSHRRLRAKAATLRHCPRLLLTVRERKSEESEREKRERKRERESV